ncbi:hypothetical protein PYCC9005_004415 [Savitreella phatthalungensis]
MTLTFEQALAKKTSERTLALAKASEALAAIPSSAYDGEILAASAKTIADKCRAGEWKAIETVAAFARKALEQHARLNFITECMIVEALDKARQQDANPDKRGKLQGVPCSIKDQFDVRGLDSSVGISRYCDDPASNDAVLVSSLRRNGAIIMFKTNVPQTLMTNESSNPIFGKTGNPANPDYTCGGSSGGEGASLGSGSSALGIGTDIAGSLRYPTHFSGGYSLKPSEDRWPRKGMFDFDRSAENLGIKPVSGPMGRFVEDIELLWQVVLEDEPWLVDSSTLQIPHRKYEAKGRQRFAYYVDDTFSKVSPACRRAVEEAVAALRAQGHICEEIVPPRVSEAVHCFVALTSADGNVGMKKLLGKDPWERNVAMEMVFPPLPRFVRQLLGFALDGYFKDRQFTDLLRICGKQSWDELSKWNWTRSDLKQHWLDNIWRAGGFDAIICPVYPLPAVKHGETREILPVATTTYLYNLLDYPAGVIPSKMRSRARTHTKAGKGYFTRLCIKGS